MAKFLDPSLKTLPCMKTSPVSCENQSFLLFWNVATLIESHCVFLCYFLQYAEVFLISLLNSYCHYLVFIDPVKGCSKSKLLVKEEFHWKVKSELAMYISDNFCCCSFLLWSIFSPPVDVQLKRLNSFCWAYPRLIFFRVNWQ